MEILKKEQILSPPSKITKYTVKAPIPFETKYAVYGIDPGTTNFGLAYLAPFNPDVAFLFYAKLQRSKNPVERILLAQNVLSICFTFFTYKGYSVIEGASFGNTHRQVELAEVRASSALWCLKKNIEPKILPPKTIRKGVFGNGNVKASDRWKEVPSDAADALACAYFSYWNFSP